MKKENDRDRQLCSQHAAYLSSKRNDMENLIYSNSKEDKHRAISMYMDTVVKLQQSLHTEQDKDIIEEVKLIYPGM